MITKCKSTIEKTLEDYKHGRATKEQCLQCLQNIIGEEVERSKSVSDPYVVEEDQENDNTLELNLREA